MDSWPWDGWQGPWVHSVIHGIYGKSSCVHGYTSRSIILHPIISNPFPHQLTRYEGFVEHGLWFKQAVPSSQQNEHNENTSTLLDSEQPQQPINTTAQHEWFRYLWVIELSSLRILSISIVVERTWDWIFKQLTGSGEQSLLLFICIFPIERLINEIFLSQCGWEKEKKLLFTAWRPKRVDPRFCRYRHESSSAPPITLKLS